MSLQFLPHPHFHFHPQSDENVTIKKSLENRIRGWFPQESLLFHMNSTSENKKEMTKIQTIPTKEQYDSLRNEAWKWTVIPCIVAAVLVGAFFYYLVVSKLVNPALFSPFPSTTWILFLSGYYLILDTYVRHKMHLNQTLTVSVILVFAGSVFFSVWILVFGSYISSETRFLALFATGFSGLIYGAVVEQYTKRKFRRSKIPSSILETKT
jgi:hypothetical protein